MVKRSNTDLDTDSPYRKRQKLTEAQAVKAVATDIQSLQDLQACLAFKQETGAEQFRQSIGVQPPCMT